MKPYTLSVQTSKPKKERIDRSNVPALLNDLDTRFPNNSFADARGKIEAWFGIDTLKAKASEHKYKPKLAQFKESGASPYLVACVPVVRRILTNCRNASNVVARKNERTKSAVKSAETFKYKYELTQKKLEAALALARKHGAPEKDVVRIEIGILPPTFID